MNRNEHLDSIARYFGRLFHEVRAQNAIGRFDINSTTEDFLVPILKVVFSCPDLTNQNHIQQNFPAVDLGCRTKRISFQVTTDATSEKITKTLEKFTQHGLDAHFDSVYVITITEKQSSYTAQALDAAISALPIAFRKSDNILDLDDILSRIKLLDTGDLEVVDAYLKSEFEKSDQHVRFRANLDQFLEFSTRKIDVEKASKKYIPDIFVETHSTKEEMRAFSNPLFFYRKVKDALSQIDYDELNALFALAGEPPLAIEIDCHVLEKDPATCVQLARWSRAVGDAVDRELRKVRPLSWDRESGDPAYVPRDEQSAAWSIIRVKVKIVASGQTSRLREARNLIDLMQKKVFLITSMAGQGKTNFICDLIEKQFAAFEIPCIFIPARELNSYPAHARILSFISNNRYSPNFTKLHNFLELFDSIARDIGKPFMIAIDGINEVKELEEFNEELKEFCAAVCQYDFIKTVITCRSEFFGEKYTSILDQPYRDQIYRVMDLRANMSDASKDRLLRGYLRHFKITVHLAEVPADFLKDDLLLLRIFCEQNEGKNIGFVTAIYKGDLFEDFLKMKFRQFPEPLRTKAFPTLVKIVTCMLDADDYAKLSIRGFEADELQVVQRLVTDDIILRQEVPEQGLASFGDIVVSFTYDELRDFVIAYKLVDEVTDSSAAALEEVLSRLSERPLYEGVYKYAYLLARKSKKRLAVAACESVEDFLEHFSLNVNLLPPTVQNDDDVVRCKEILADIAIPRRVKRIANFLHRRRSTQEPLNILLLIEHMNGLDDEKHLVFIRTLFSDSYGYHSGDWRQKIGNLIERVWEASSEDGLGKYVPGWLSFFLHASSLAWWGERERAAALFGNSLSHDNCQSTLALVRAAQAQAVQSMIAEIEATEEVEA
ncbi:SMEK domain-containing protein [Acetobacter fabarum]|uniref:SMEK domain-containing protein n=1 Tax=Acetobacter fabarum TaxID=483199 RepID=UPI0033A79D2E